MENWGKSLKESDFGHHDQTLLRKRCFILEYHCL
jgi:hypothetical protein